MDPLIVASITLLATLAIILLALFALAGFDAQRFRLALRACGSILRDPALAEKVKALFQPAEQKPTKPSGAPLRLLTVLQRDGRLLDFLLEDIQGYGDEQVGAAVRDIHRQCQSALKEHLVLEPVLTQPEGSDVEVPAGFDPSAIRLTGNVTGQPPFRGVLRHHGWRVKEMKLAPPPEGQDEFVVAPAEVELP
ncbi:MAG TPA: DUF2760 domain-containing protein [Gemmataceae bacterium]|nr:DUF2760 domain-containing protein [Gemmataceae bacterium]